MYTNRMRKAYWLAIFWQKVPREDKPPGHVTVMYAGKRQTPCEQTNTCENITFPILRMLTVKIRKVGPGVPVQNSSI